MPEAALEGIREKAREFREEHPELCRELNREFREYRKRKIFGLSEGPGKTGESEPKQLGEIPPSNILEVAGGTRFLSSILDL